ncbi:type A2 lantipeptide [Streptomyces sp. QTS137]
MAYPYEGKFHHELHPQVETVEISDAELDTVHGGLSVNAVNTLTGAVDGIAPVFGPVDTAVGTVEGVSGLDTAPVTNLVAGL